MPFSTKNTFKQLSANEEAKAVIEKFLPGFWTNPQSKQAMNMSVKAVAAFPQAGIDKAKLAAIDEELAKIP